MSKMSKMEYYEDEHFGMIYTSDFLKYLRKEADFHEERMRLTEDDKDKLRRLLEPIYGKEPAQHINIR